MSLLHRTTTHPHHDSHRFNPHTYWTAVVCISILVIAAELLYFSWFFIQTTEKLDAPAIPTFETNSSKIRAMNNRLDAIERAIVVRVEKGE